jgi:hypothetical protein
MSSVSIKLKGATVTPLRTGTPRREGEICRDGAPLLTARREGKICRDGAPLLTARTSVLGEAGEILSIPLGLPGEIPRFPGEITLGFSGEITSGFSGEITSGFPGEITSGFPGVIA